ncbi:MAG: zinc ribbon domain-containing protein [Methanoregulaceae archaeon]|nr:zinc ribbon domain-containing protein [Methanoregulaceae archaeon]
MASPRFCTACGTPLSQGSRFCEQCGQQVEGPIPAPSRHKDFIPEMPVIIPFGTMQGGIFSQKDLVLVITTDSLIAVVPKGEVAGAINGTREKISESLDESGISGRDFWEVSASLSPGLSRAYLASRQVPADLRSQVSSIRSRFRLEQAPWLRYATMTPAEIVAENPESRHILLEDILYVRGEDLVEDQNGEDLLVVRTKDQDERYRLALGCYYPARVTLISLLEKRQQMDPSSERIISIVPACFEPGPKDFDFQYVFNLIFTDRRLILAVTPGGEDEVEQAWDRYMERLGNIAKEKGVSLEAYAAGADLDDAPWQEFHMRAIPEILDADGVNYFIPYAHLRGVAYRGGRKPKISLSFPSHIQELEANPLFAPSPLKKAQQGLQGIVSITL